MLSAKSKTVIVSKMRPLLVDSVLHVGRFYGLSRLQRRPVWGSLFTLILKELSPL